MNEDVHGRPDASHHDPERDAANTMLELMHTQPSDTGLSGDRAGPWELVPSFRDPFDWDRPDTLLRGSQERLPSLEYLLEYPPEELISQGSWTPFIPRLGPQSWQSLERQPFREVTLGSPTHVSQEPLLVSTYAASSAGYSSYPKKSLAPNARFKCSHSGCSSSFQRRADLTRHMNSLHRENEMPPFPCPILGCSRVKEFGFHREDKLADHLRLHSKDITKNTPTIDKFSQLEENASVIQDSTVTSSFAEDVYTPSDQHSGKALSPTPQIHRIPTFPCNQPDCSMTFYSEWNLKRHLMSHTPAHRFECSICEKKFRYPKDLSRHTKTHGDKSEPRYRCSVAGCPRNKLGEAFTKRADLKRHIEVIHPGTDAHAITSAVVFSCAFCGREFSRKDNLSRHMWKSHAASTEHVQLKPVEAPNK